MKPISKIRTLRLIVAATFYAGGLGVFGTWYYFNYIHDVGATYWSIGLFGLPVAILILWGLDRLLSKRAFFQNNSVLLTFILCGLCVPLYYILGAMGVGVMFLLNT